MHKLLRGLVFAYFGFHSATGLLGRSYLAPLYGDDSSAIEGDYMVAFHDNYTMEHHWQAIGMDLSNTPGFTGFTVLPGYGAEMDEDTLRLVRQDPGVKFVENNVEFDLHDWGPYTEVPIPEKNVDHAHVFKRDYNTVTNPEAPYGLRMVGAAGKISIPRNPDRTFDYGNYEFLYKAGEGVNVYVFDTGIHIEDRLFQGRARNFGGKGPSDTSPYIDEVMRDEVGHGTHVAGIIAAQQYGVAPFANIINVKVLSNGTRKNSIKRMTKALNDVIAEHQQNRATKKGFEFRGSVINMSFGGGFTGFNLWFDLAIGSANWNGITVVAAAGNENNYAEYSYPCAYDTVLCVAAVDNEYKRASFSNYGAAVDFTAPGVSIESLGLTGYATRVMSGTSQACAHVSGIAAIFVSWLGLANDDAASYVWWNSLSGLHSGMGLFDRSTFANTGLHSPKKYPKEPFRWAGDNPAANPRVQPLNNTGVVSAATMTPSPLASSLLLSTAFTSFVSTAPVISPSSRDTTVYTFAPSFSNGGSNATMSTVNPSSFTTAQKTLSDPPPACTKPNNCIPDPIRCSATVLFPSFLMITAMSMNSEGHKIVQDDDTSKVHVEWYYQPDDNASVYDIYWEPGCTTAVSQRDAFHPMGPTNYNCTSLLERDYRQCNNGGAGGKATVGCVTYAFSIGAKYSD